MSWISGHVFSQNWCHRIEMKFTQFWTDNAMDSLFSDNGISIFYLHPLFLEIKCQLPFQSEELGVQSFPPSNLP